MKRDLCVLTVWSHKSAVSERCGVSGSSAWGQRVMLALSASLCCLSFSQVWELCTPTKKLTWNPGQRKCKTGKAWKKVKERGARWEVEHKWSPLYFWHSWAHLITLSFKEILQVQYKLSSIDNIYGIMLITTKNSKKNNNKKTLKFEVNRSYSWSGWGQVLEDF